MRRAAIYLVILVLMTETVPGLAQTKPPSPPAHLEQKLKDAKAAQQKGDHDRAIKAWQEVQQHARVNGLKHIEGEALISQGRVLQASAKGDPAKTRVFEKKAEDVYRAALQVDEKRTNFQAHNNLGVLYFRQGNTAGAIKILNETKLDPELRPVEKAAFYYNFGRVLEKDQPNQALQKYQQALKLNPENRLAAEGAFRVLLGPAVSAPLEQDAGKHVALAVKLADTFVKQGNSGVAIRSVQQRLESNRPIAGAQELLAVLVRSYAEHGVTPEEFRSSEWTNLQRIRRTQPQLTRAIDEIHKAYAGTFPTLLHRQEVQQLFPSWVETEPLRTSFGSVLQRLGDFYALQAEERKTSGDNEKALKYYASTWLLDPKNTAAALRTAAVFRNYRQEIDPTHERYESFIEEILEEKGQTYRIDTKTKEDWKNILNLHFLLGTLFEQEEQWGSESNRRSAIFQWHWALRAEDRLRALDPQTPLYPIINEHLAKCYRAQQRQSDAWDQYVTAAEGYVQSKRHRQAAAAVVQAKQVQPEARPEQAARLANLEARLRQP